MVDSIYLFLIMIIQVIIPPIPAELIILDFASKQGIFITTFFGGTGLFLGSLIVFFFSSYLRKFFKLDKVNIIEKKFQKYGFWILLIRVLPYNPSDIISYGAGILNYNKKKYVVICDGSQGEPGKLLYDIVNGNTSLTLDNKDKIVFSSSEIPHPVLSQYRKELMSKITEIKCKAFTGMHVSGHATKADIKDLLVMTKPKYIIPTQGSLRAKEGIIEVGEELHYEEGETLFIVNDGKVKELK